MKQVVTEIFLCQYFLLIALVLKQHFKQKQVKKFNLGKWFLVLTKNQNTFL